MNKQHLQIGNIVSYHGQPVQVRTVTRHKVGVLTSNEHTKPSYAHLRGIEPIPITEEWLVNNEFEKFYDDICEFSYYTKEVDGNYIDIKLDCSNIDENHVVCHVDNCYRCTIGCADIQYVHQLQNFLNLLDIKMKVEP